MHQGGDPYDGCGTGAADQFPVLGSRPCPPPDNGSRQPDATQEIGHSRHEAAVQGRTDQKGVRIGYAGHAQGNLFIIGKPGEIRCGQRDHGGLGA